MTAAKHVRNRRNALRRSAAKRGEATRKVLNSLAVKRGEARRNKERSKERRVRTPMGAHPRVAKSVPERGRAKMTYRIKSHQTRYAGVKFRSRLEATWAAFFDRTGWQWTYEPIDLEGWSPDFEISHPKLFPGKILVEVKPTWEMAREAIDKIEASGVPQALLLANGPGHPEQDDWITGGTTYCGKFGSTFGVLCYFAQGEEPYENEFVAFQPRIVTDKDWAEATNITRWKVGA